MDVSVAGRCWSVAFVSFAGFELVRAICKPKPKRIKICTGAELRKMCPPQTCYKEMPKKRQLGLLKFLGFGMKSILAAALVYVSYDMGIWGTTDDTQELYGTACAMFKGPRPKRNDKWDPPSCEAESDLFTHSRYDPYGHCNLPPIRAEDSYLKFQRYWNKTIQAVFSGIAHFPYNVMGKINKTTTDGENAENACVPFSQLDPAEQKKITNKYK